jgi:hypothetical protein
MEGERFFNVFDAAPENDKNYQSTVVQKTVSGSQFHYNYSICESILMDFLLFATYHSRNLIISRLNTSFKSTYFTSTAWTVM